MGNTQKKSLAIVVTILFIFGLLLRCIGLGQLPAAMHRDEVAIANNAYSILLTGRDEHGQGPYPMTFQSYGDYKLPGTIYLTASSIATLGFNTWSVRFPTALLASLAIIVIFFFVWELLQDTTIALVASGLLTFSIWHTSLARTIYEPIISVTLLLAGLTCWLRGRSRPAYLVVATVFFGAGFFTYNMPTFLVPIILVASLFFFRQVYAQRTGRVWLAVALCVIGVSFYTSQRLMIDSNQARWKATIFANKDLMLERAQFVQSIEILGVPHRLAKLMALEPVETIVRFAKGYLAAFNPVYLFFEGGNNQWHSLRSLQMGNENLALLLPLIVGLWVVVVAARRNKVVYQFLLLLLVAYPIPDAMTVDAPVTNRLLDFHLLLLVFAAIGIVTLFRQKTRLAKVVLVGFCIGYGLWWSRFALLYSVGHRAILTDMWMVGLNTVLIQNQDLLRSSEIVYVDDNKMDNHPFIYAYLLFYTGYDPHQFQSEAVWDTDDVFLVSHHFGKFFIGDYLPATVRAEHPKAKITYIEKNRERNTWTVSQL